MLDIMPDKIFSEKLCMANDGILAKVLVYDISQQLQPAALPSIDAANCYDPIVHAIAALVFQAFGNPRPMIQTM
jgi:hypothetical protein